MFARNRKKLQLLLVGTLLGGLIFWIVSSLHSTTIVSESNPYKDICYQTVTSADECKGLCDLDELCYYAEFYKHKAPHNCFMQLFHNDLKSSVGCRRYNVSRDDIIYFPKAVSPSFHNQRYLIDTPVCHKPNYHPFDSSLISIVNRGSLMNKHQCSKSVNRRFTIVDDSIMLLKEPARGEDCQYRYIYRTDEKQETDNVYFFTDWKSLSTQPSALTDEFVEVTCSRGSYKTYIDYVSYVPIKLAEKNAKKAQQRRAQSENKGSRRFDEKLSLYFFGIDCTSLNQARRMLPRTLGYLNRHMDAITLSGYNRVQDNTFMNLYAVLNGKPILEDVNISMFRHFDDDPVLFKWFNKDGFVTGYYEDYKTGALFNWLKKGFQYKPTDHYFRPFALVIEQTVAQTWYNDFCYLDKGTHEWVTEWAKSFATQYSKVNHPYFLWTWITLLSHEYPTLLAKGDALFYEALRHLHTTNSLNNTVLIFFSDHGFRYGGLRATKIGQHEENHPMMHFVFPEWFKKKYPKDYRMFKSNAENRLITPFDIHRTALEFADGALESADKEGREKFGQNLFEPIDERRTCADAGIPDHFCGCRHAVDESLQGNLTMIAAKAVVERVNNITEHVRSKCYVYSLRTVKAVYRNYRHDISDDKLVELAVTVAMQPSSAEFSATVHVYLDSRKPSVKGMSRVSLYGDSANCMSDFRMRLYCTCK